MKNILCQLLSQTVDNHGTLIFQTLVNAVSVFLPSSSRLRRHACLVWKKQPQTGSLCHLNASCFMSLGKKGGGVHTCTPVFSGSCGAPAPLLSQTICLGCGNGIKDTPFPPFQKINSVRGHKRLHQGQEERTGYVKERRVWAELQCLSQLTLFIHLFKKRNMHSLELYYKYDGRLSFLTVHLGNLLMSIYPIDDIKLDPKFQKGHALIFFSSFRSSDLALLISSFNNAWSFLDVNFAQQKCQERLFLMHFFLPLTWCITMTWNVHFIVANFLQYTTLQMWT